MTQEVSNEIKVQVINKIWGYETLITPHGRCHGYTGKRMFLKQGFHCSLHFHINKHETFWVESGFMELEIMDRDGNSTIKKLYSGDAVMIYPGELHRFYGIQDTVFFEFSTPDSPADSYRASKSGQGRPKEWSI